MTKDTDFQNALDAYVESQKKIYHIPVNLGVSAFKREARLLGLPKSTTNKLIQAYKKRSWMEYQGIARNRGSYPAHRAIGNKIEVKYTESKHNVTVK